MNKYEDLIFTMAEIIIDKKDYPLLCQVLTDYDRLVKKEKLIDNEEKPHWCLDWWG